MEALIGITGADYVLLAADQTSARSIVVMKSTESKFRDLGPSLCLSYCGEPGDTVNFAEYVQGNVKLYQMRNELPLSTTAAAHYTRRLLADSLRSRTPYSVNVLVAGCSGEGEKDKDANTITERKSASPTPKLFWIDYLATLTELPFAAHGYASYFVLSLMDRHYRRGMGVEDGLALLRMCLQELKKRFIVNLPTFSIKIIRATGIETLTLSV